jgi:D-beta-D-heptose 7-phosphate kinase/D-beta-D-heptose 1-phosphate adenosyltransferase
MAKTKTLVIASGYFNPLHRGHIEYLNQSKELGDFLFVIINNDLQRGLKGSKEFQNALERKYIVENLKSVNAAMVAVDDNRLVDKSIEFIYNWRGSEFGKILFTNGGDQTEATIGEKDMCEKLGIQMVFGLGDKIQSSSWLLNK